MHKKLGAEFIGTFWLVFGGCGAAVLAGQHIGWLGVALAFGLTVLTMAYAVGHISGGHFNPAVTIGLAAGGRFNCKEILPYIIFQCLGATLAAAVLYVIATGLITGPADIGNFAANGYAEHSPGGYGLTAAFVAEFVLTFGFLVVIMGTTSPNAPVGLAPLAIGLALALIHLVGIPITNTSVNPARSLSQALFVQGWALSQLWLFFVAPILGGIAGALFYRIILAGEKPCCKSQKN